MLLDLGTQEYGRVWALQKYLVGLRERDLITDVLLLVEHPHVITVGRRGAELPPGLPLPVYWVERGGMATYHGPGQLVGYPIVKLTERSFTVRQYLRLLEEALIKTVTDFGLSAGRVEGHSGVWIKGRKLASIGIAVKNWVTYHGFALNVNTDLSYFRLISPCGLNPEVMTSLELELGKSVDMQSVKASVLTSFMALLGEKFDPIQPQELGIPVDLVSA